MDEIDSGADQSSFIEQNQSSIQQNLMLLSNKKQKAQEVYYGTVSGQSPLTRNASATNNFQQNAKKPVHQRLGNKKFTLRRMNNFPKNTIRLRRTNQRNGVQRNVQNSVFRKNQPAQVRLQRIRQEHVYQTMQNEQQMPIRIYRRKPGGPANLVVRVENNPNFRNNLNNSFPRAHSIQACLDPQIQLEISILQSQNIYSRENLPNTPIHPQSCGMTNVFINERLSQLP